MIKKATAMSTRFDYLTYYREQAGGSIDAYTSLRYLPAQRGSGFFGRLIKGTVWPLIQQMLPYAKKKALEGVGNMVTELGQGSTFKEASKKILKKTGEEIIGDAAAKVQEKLQQGSGVRRRRRLKESKGKRKRGRPPKRKRSAAVKRSVLFP